ncbi:MAG: metallophosphoesterase [Bacteroidales bacterium]|nr:metallophosphoesterase [Bacteroidales bacterium]
MKNIIITLCFFFSFISISFSQKNNIVVVQISDPQFGFIEDNKSFEPEEKLLSQALKKINFIAPDFLVVTGDFIHDPESAEQTEAFKKVMRTLDKNIPLYYTPGNHDLNNSPTIESLARYQERYSKPLYSSIVKNGVRFIFMNSVIIKAEYAQDMEQEQIKWLESLIKDTALPTVVFLHHPFFLNDFDEENNYSTIDKEKRAKYWELFKRLNVKNVFAGHLHNESAAEYQGISMITTSALGRPLGKTPSGLRIIKISNEKNNISVTSNYYEIKDIPLQ